LKRKSYLLAATLLSIFLFTGCSEDEELSAFRTSFDEFCTNVATIDSSINSIDASTESAPDELLALLDELELEFQKMADLEVPEEFAYLENLADEASENMSLAVENYHTAYKAESYDTYSADIASQYYERAYKRIRYMITFMQGEIPDDENVSVEIIEE